MEQADHQLSLRDGRTLGYADLGDPDGAPVVMFHGFPGSRRDALLGESSALRCGVHLICPDRPGYGLSSFKPGRTLADFSTDVMELADALGLGSFYLLGVSGGGPYALGCACLHPQRIRGVSLVCGLGCLAGVRALSAMQWPARISFSLTRSAPAVAEFFYRRVLGPLIRSNPALALRLLCVHAPEADRQVLGQSAVLRILKASIAEAFRQGARGAAQDLGIYAAPWGFDPTRIDLPMDIWHGQDDATVPALHSHTLASAMPRARLHLVPGEGHFSLPVRHMDEIFSNLCG